MPVELKDLGGDTGCWWNLNLALDPGADKPSMPTLSVAQKEPPHLASPAGKENLVGIW